MFLDSISMQSVLHKLNIVTVAKGPVIEYVLGGLEVLHNFFNNFSGLSKIVNRNFRAHQILQDIFHDPPIFSSHYRNIQGVSNKL